MAYDTEQTNRPEPRRPPERRQPDTPAIVGLISVGAIGLALTMIALIGWILASGPPS
ncbi:MAG: hypothetical protein AAF467_06505 [Actinomycetota bacterium]